MKKRTFSEFKFKKNSITVSSTKKSQLFEEAQQQLEDDADSLFKGSFLDDLLTPIKAQIQLPLQPQYEDDLDAQNHKKRKLNHQENQNDKVVFVLKKDINKEEDISPDINIQSKQQDIIDMHRPKKIGFQVISSSKKLKDQYQQINTKQMQGNDLSNHNLILNKKSKVNQALKILREMKSKPRFKDKYGNNVKQHFGIYKYFINTQTQEKDKFYISHECQKIMASRAFQIIQKEIQKIGLTTKDKNRLEYWGLPSGICEQFYRQTKITKLFDWQAECLSQSPEVLQGTKNLIYFAPTSGGKSVVSEILMLRQILGFKKRAIYVLPFVSIVAEKQQYLSKLCENINLKIIGLHSQSENVWSAGVDIAICTIEKANSLLNRIIEEKIYFDIDEGRGYQLESLIAKVRAVEKILNKKNSFQIVGMSATLSGLNYLMDWFGGNCAIYECQFRPVPLSEYLQINSKLYTKDMKLIMDFNTIPKMIQGQNQKQQFGNNSDQDQLMMITSSYLRKKKAVLIFCPTKDQCEQTAKRLASSLPIQYQEYESQQPLTYDDIDSEVRSMIKDQTLRNSKNPNFQQKSECYDKLLQGQRLRILNELMQCSTGLCATLKQTIKYGIAYHHSGLTSEEREIIERGYRNGILLVLVATSTLSTGINLPAKAVIFKGPFIANQLIDAAKYKQMSGRAGRTGFDAKGDSIMICQNQHKDYVLGLMKPFQCELKSALTGQRLMRSLLEIIASNIVTSFVQIRIFIESTLKYTLCHKQKCQLCSHTHSQNGILFGISSEISSNTVIDPSKASPTASQILLDKAYTQYDLYLQTFTLDSFSNFKQSFNNILLEDEIQDESCKNCMLEFAKQVVAYLAKFKFLAFSHLTGQILPTQLGKAAFASSIPPEYSLKIFEDLAEARGNLVLESDLHLLYLITPHFKQIREPNWEAFISKYQRLTKAERNIADFYGIEHEYLFRAAQFKPKLPSCVGDQGLLNNNNGQNKSAGCKITTGAIEKQLGVQGQSASYTQSTMNNSSRMSTSASGSSNVSVIGQVSMSQMDQLIQLQNLTKEDEKLIRYSKFYMALVMNEILKETPIVEICRVFKCKRGDIQTMQALAVNYSGMLSAFCERLFWSDYSVLLMRINEKINWCVKEELLDLMQLPSLRPERARALYNDNFTTVESIGKEATVEGIVKVFSKNDGFMSHRKSNEEDLKLKYDIYYTVAHKIICEAKMILVKRKVDPDRTLMSYMQDQQKLVNDQQYVLDSDYSSDGGSDQGDNCEKNVQKFHNLSLLSDLDSEDLSFTSNLSQELEKLENMDLNKHQQNSTTNDLDRLLQQQSFTINLNDNEKLKIDSQNIPMQNKNDQQRFDEPEVRVLYDSDLDEDDIQGLLQESDQEKSVEQNSKEDKTFNRIDFINQASPDFDLIYEALLQDDDNEQLERQVETIASEVREQPIPQPGHLFLIDQEKLNSKLSTTFPHPQPLLSTTDDDNLLNICFEVQLNFTEFVRENKQKRLIKIDINNESDDNVMIEVALVTLNRLMILSNGGERLFKKSKLKLNQWNSLQIIFNKDKEIVVKINGIVKIKEELEALKKIKLRDLLNAQITIGGHLSSLKQENKRLNHLFNGFMKGLNLIINLNQNQNNQEEEEKKGFLQIKEEIKSTDYEHNNDKFVFIHSLYELAKFNPQDYKYHKSTVKLVNRPQRDRKIMICHDIPLGLLEEGYTQGLYPTTSQTASQKQQEIQQSWYRFTHWHYIDIFIYFGHYTVCLPPPGLIDIAHQHGVKVLSVLIFEWEEGGKEAKIMLDGKISMFKDHQDVMKFSRDAPEGNKFYAKKLVEIAKYFGFEGYLMNFECSIDDTQVLMDWLVFLRDELHREIPGSMVVWYDSVLHDGSLIWQSQLNDKNYKFFQATDGFFTDYHWKLNYLQETLDHYNKFIKDSTNLSTYDIYYGNDTYGRGTYGGGKLDIYKAIHEIQKLPYSIALFGQCFYYENLGGHSHSNIFNINEEMFWKGRNMILYAESTGKKYPIGQPISKDKLQADWNVIEGDGKWKLIQNGSTLQFQTMQYFTIIYLFRASHQLCTKKMIITVEELLESKIITNLEDLKSLILIFRVSGTKPDYKDPYRFSITLLDSQSNTIFLHNPVLYVVPQSEYLFCKESGAPTYEYAQIALNNEILQKLDRIEIIIEGKDAEYWGGWYGAQFSEERIYFEVNKSKDEIETNLLSLFQSRLFAFESVCTYFNIGYGNSYYINGALIFDGNYSNIQEYDLYLIKNASNTYLSLLQSHFNCFVDTNGPHYQGGSSYHIIGKLQGVDDEILIPLQDVEILNYKSDTLYDLKIAFKLEYKLINDGSITFIIQFTDNSKEEFIIFNKEIKQHGLIYLDNKWAIYDQRMIDFQGKQISSISLKISQTTLQDIDLRIGMISIVPTLFVEPDQFKLILNPAYPLAQDNLQQHFHHSKKFKDIHLAWKLEPLELEQHYLKHYRIFRNGSILGTVRLSSYIDEKVEISKGVEYRVEAISLRNEKIAELIIGDIQ